MIPDRADIAGVVLAGGLSRRMGGHDKGLLRLGGRTLVERVVGRLQPQVAAILISSNDPAPEYTALGVPLVADRHPGHPGPLAGLEAAWLAQGFPWLVSVPVDLPFLPRDLVVRLAARADDGTAVVAASGGRVSPVVGLWPRRVLPGITRRLEQGELRLMAWLATLPHRVVELPPGAGGRDPLFNINDPAALAQAEAWLLAEGEK